jgi:hypothetical protein
MSQFRPHGARILCVAGSDGEFPEPVRRWLDQVGVRTEFSPDIYDALAVLATGTRPIVMIVSADAVDWDEMDFFGHVQALSRGTHIYVTTRHPDDSRVFAATERGAKVFESTLAQADLEAVFAEPLSTGTVGNLVAGSLRPSEPSRIPAGASTPAVETPPPAPSAGTEAAPQGPPIRLVTSTESDEGEHVRVPVPWAPHPDRPKRTPPKPLTTPETTRGHPGSGSEMEKPLPRVDLTPEEIAALLGRPASETPRAKEGS